MWRALARMLTIFATTTNVTVPSIQGLLLNRSRDIDTASLAVDTSVLLADVAYGYGSTAHPVVISPLGGIPYCVPMEAGNYTAKEDMSYSKYLDVAMLMGRTAITAYIRDATNGLPLSGANGKCIEARPR